jgi:hypothetical protein
MQYPLGGDNIKTGCHGEKSQRRCSNTIPEPCSARKPCDEMANRVCCRSAEA